MKSLITLILVYIVLAGQNIYCQVTVIDKGKFFTSDTTIHVTIEALWAKLVNQRHKAGRIFPARFKCELPGGVVVNEAVSLEVRGHFRRDYCYLPPLKLSFKKTSGSLMYPLKSLKLVNVCKTASTFEQYLLREMLVYKIYNLLTEKSFRVRLLNIDFKDSSGKKGPGILPAFLMEDLKDLAKRNNCREWTGGKVVTEASERNQMTLVALFEFMIGNTDWSVTGQHNIKLIQSISDSISRPFAIPYDFDYSGLVNTDYAIPDPLLEKDNVRQRVYRGYPRTVEELDKVLDIFKQQKENIYSLINNFEALSQGNKKNMISYLEEFYELIKKPRNVRYYFIDHARTD